ncbi:MAG: murein biosynthesis integral membrane protein MurJ [Planctomycetota bacterium]|jgi:putative peptidoglycan lipid II flippase|nr:murein biosynthesis integral membrane protein MurJ [Planctomycetota bacterium]
MPTSSLKSVSLLSLCSLGQMFLQFAFQVVLAKHFGASVAMDAFAAGMALPIVICTTLVGSLGYSFVPTFLERMHEAGEEEAWKLANSVGLLLVLLTGGISVGGCLLAGPIMQALHPGFSAEQLHETVRVFRVLSWLTLANSMTTFLQALYHSYQRYTPTAIGPLAGVALTVVWTILLHEEWGILAGASGVVAGAVLCNLIQSPLYLRHFKLRISFDASFKKCMRLLGPLIIGALYYNLDPLVDRYLASKMSEGSIAHLGYAWRLINGVLILCTSGLSIVIFPVLIEHFVAGRELETKKEIAFAIRFLAFILVPVGLGLVLFSRPIVHDLFERGQFEASDTAAVALLLAIYVGVVIGASLGEISAKIFFAIQDTWTPVIIKSIGFTVGAVLKILLGPEHGVEGIVLATSVYYILNSVIQLLVIRKRLGPGMYTGVPAALLRSIVSSAVALSVAWFVFNAEIPYASIPAILVSIVCYAVVTWLLKDEFTLKFVEAMRGRG